MTALPQTAELPPAPRGERAPKILSRARDLVEPALRAAVNRLDETNRRISAYHMGWTDLNGNPTSGGGKGVRPALATVSACAAGASAGVGVPGAVAVELVHNFSLLHDDVMDGDIERRHRPTVWAAWGTANAILAGDALLALAVEVLLDTPADVAGVAGAAAAARGAAAVRLLTETTRELIRGQSEDVAFERRGDVGLAECLRMAAGKTGSLLSASAAIGAVLAGAPTRVVRALSRYGSEVGVAFQLVDDLLGIWGDPARTGKSVFSDLRSKKKSLPVTYAITTGGAAARELAAWLAAEHTPRARDGVPLQSRGERPVQSNLSSESAVRSENLGCLAEAERLAEAGPDEAELRRAAELVEAAGGRRWANEEAARRLQLAERALHGVDLDPTAREDLLEIAYFVVAREA